MIRQELRYRRNHVFRVGMEGWGSQARIRVLFVRPALETNLESHKHGSFRTALTISANQARRTGSGGVENLNFPSLAASRLFRSIVSEVPPVTSTVITSGTATGFPHARAASPMSPNEEMTQASRPKRPAAGTAVSSAAAAAGTRLRRPAPSKVRAEKSRPKETLCLRDLQRDGQRGDGASVRAARSSPGVQTRVNRRGSIPRTRLDGFPARSRP